MTLTVPPFESDFKDRRYKGVLFDLDGVLVDACEWHYEALNRALKQVCGYEISREEHESTFNALTSHQKLQILSDRGDIDIMLSGKVWQLKQDLTIRVIKEKAEPDELKIKLLCWLREHGYKIGCVTNSVKQSARLMLELTGQLEYLDILVTNSDVIHPKPAAEAYIKAMVHLSLEPKDVLIVEDTDKGAQAAAAACADCMRVKNGTEVTLENLLKELA